MVPPALRPPELAQVRRQAARQLELIRERQLAIQLRRLLPRRRLEAKLPRAVPRQAGARARQVPALVSVQRERQVSPGTRWAASRARSLLPQRSPAN